MYDNSNVIVMIYQFHLVLLLMFIHIVWEYIAIRHNGTKGGREWCMMKDRKRKVEQGMETEWSKIPICVFRNPTEPCCILEVLYGPDNVPCEGARGSGLMKTTHTPGTRHSSGSLQSKCQLPILRYPNSGSWTGNWDQARTKGITASNVYDVTTERN
jgi:hypothetical protein